MTTSALLLPVILCGGSGTRLWPLSRESQPKQFLNLFSATSQNSLLQETVLRLNSLSSQFSLSKKPLLICNAEHRFLVAGQLAAVNVAHPNIILEPVGRNTAPALTLAALQAVASANNANIHCDTSVCVGANGIRPNERDTDSKRANAIRPYAEAINRESIPNNETNDPILLVMPADHIIGDLPAFNVAIQKAWQIAQESQSIVTFGIEPNRPETGYGYIECADSLPNALGFHIAQFTEKPDEQTALCYQKSGKHLWNSGLFMVRASIWLKAIGACNPAILKACEAALQNARRDDFVRLDEAAFKACPSDSIDYAVMEHLPRKPQLDIQACVVPMKANWSDIGAWDALWDVWAHDENHNATQGEVVLHNAKNSLVIAGHRLVAGIGLKDVVIVETADAVLVADKNQTQDVKHIVAQLKTQKHTLANTHRKTHRPWGWYDSLDSGERFQVKRIVVNPNASLSLQMHHHRAEHWVVVKGTAEVTNGDKTFLLSENESTYIPIGNIHRLRNPGKLPLEIIEVQSGAYLGEDDIVRLEDACNSTLNNQQVAA